MSGTRTRIHIFASRAHKWLALILGIQLLLWFASGAVMSFFPIDEIHGDHLVDRGIVKPLPQAIDLAHPAALLAAFGRPVERMAMRMLLDRPVVEVTGGGETRLFDARTAQPINGVGAPEAETVARRAWRGAAGIAASVEPVARPSTEYRGALPAWRVSFTDPEATRVFVDARLGTITAVRTGNWRLYDFFWGLHIMDWKDHENFNSPWLLGFAIGGLLFWAGGATLLYFRWPLRRRKGARLASRRPPGRGIGG